jgi:multidrug efflux pump subunit AcrB
MRLSRFFIDRPIFAAVIAVIITVVGALAFVGLPISQYPDIVPPTVTVSAQYPGASAETVAATVATPIEQEINGVDNMLYMSSQSTGDGKVTITVTFKAGVDLDAAQVLVQNRVAVATPRLPEEVQRLGVVTRKTTPDFLMVVNLQSPDGSLNRDYLSNYALTQVRDRLARIDGVGDMPWSVARLCHAHLDRSGPAAELNLTAGEIVAALRAQNVQVSSGEIGQPPYDKGQAFQLGVETQGRLTDPQQFADIVIRTDAQGHQVRVRDVARVELGAQDYTVNTYLSNKPTVVIAVMQRPGSNALDAALKVKGNGYHRPRLSQGHGIFDDLQPHRIHQPVDRRGLSHPVRSGGAGGAGHSGLPPELARGDHSDHRHSRFADRDGADAGGAGLFAQQPVVVRAGAGDRDRRRRRHRRGRKR